MDLDIGRSLASPPLPFVLEAASCTDLGGLPLLLAGAWRASLLVVVGAEDPKAKLVASTFWGPPIIAMDVSCGIDVVRGKR